MNSSSIDYKKIFIVLVILFLVIMPLLSLDFGVTWDEWLQGHYGKLVLRYLVSGGTNHDFMSFDRSIHLYGGLFDAVTGFTYAVLFDSLENFVSSDIGDTLLNKSLQDMQGSGFYETRHIINSLVGFLAILFCGLLAKELGSWRTGVIALIFIFLSPRFLGHSMNNPKDIPFACAYVMSLYYLIRFIKELSKPKIRTVLLVSLSMAFALGIRINGVIVMFYFFLFSIIAWALLKNKGVQVISFLKLMLLIVTASLMGYLIGLIFWPFGMINPIGNFLAALRSFSNFTGGTAELLFEGNFFSNSKLPWYYISKWIFISVPLFIHIGIFLLLLVIFKNYKKDNFKFICIILFSVLFPIGYVIIKKSVLYDGWRHLLFVYPSIVALAAFSWDSVFQMLKRSFFKKAFLVLMILLVVQPLFWIFRNHPNECVYFNPIIGGVKGAYTDYQTDYWGNSLREAAEWIIEDYESPDPKSKILIEVDGNFMSTYPYFKKSFGLRYVPYNVLSDEIKNKLGPNYSILLTKKKTKEELLPGSWPPDKTVYVVKVDGATICAVVKHF